MTSDFDKAASLKPQINAAYEAVLKAEQNSLDAKIKLGELLNLAKEAVGHGAFGIWLEEHTKISHSSANVYMKLAERKDRLDAKSNSQRAGILAKGGEMSIRKALKEIQTPEEKQKAEQRKAQAKATKKANETTKAAESAGEGSTDLEDLLPDSAPDEVFAVLRDNWEEGDLTALAKLLADHLAKLKVPSQPPLNKPPVPDAVRPLPPTTMNDPRLSRS